MRGNPILTFLLLVFTVTMANGQTERGPEAQLHMIQSSGSPAVVVVDFDALFGASAFGIRVLAENEDALRALSDENMGNVVRLEAEENDLARRKPKLSDEEFTKERAKFNELAKSLREKQDKKGERIQEWFRLQEATFEAIVRQILSNVAMFSRIDVVLSKDSAIWFSDHIDATPSILERINAAYGDGTKIEGYRTAREYAQIDGVILDPAGD